MKNRTTTYLQRLCVVQALIFLLSGNLKAQNITLSSYSGQSVITAPGSITLSPGFYIPSGSNVRIYPGASFQTGTNIAWAPSNGQNYIRSRVFKVEGVNSGNIDNARTTYEVTQSVQYFDGLGRPLQTVAVQGSPSFRDIVTPVAYDAFGREAKKYLPYAALASVSNGSYKASAITEQNSFYTTPGGTTWTAPGVKSFSTGNTALSETKFEASPLNRVLEQGAPGAIWQPAASRTTTAGRTVAMEYGSNNSSTAYTTTGFAVRLYNAVAVTIAGHEHERTLSGTGYYGAGELYLTITKDENWTSGKAGTTEEYKDKEGRVVLKRTFTTTQALSTYYVYDDLGNLSYVLPPGANPDAASVPSQATLDNFCYQYRYDGRKRLIEKRIPGKGGWDNIIYNKLDQVVFTQDPEQAKTSPAPYPYMSFIKYDALGRVIMTGVEKNYTGSRQSVQDVFDNWAQIVLWETRDFSGWHGYTNVAVPYGQATMEPEVINYYDDYNISDIPNNQSGSYSKKTRGLLTATKVKVLGTASDYLWTVNYYDDEGRVVRVWKHHYKGGVVSASNYDEITNTYNFAGELTYSTRSHKVGTATTTIATRYEYDHMGRRKAVMESINGQAEVVLAKLDYNEVGQLWKKDLHSSDNGSTFIQNNEYAYNERGWMTKINDPNSVTATKVFGMELAYGNTADSYNGNISSMSWQTRVPAGLGLSQQLQSYSYTYDKLNRLTSAAYNSSGAAAKFNEELSYDEMGNILTLKRKNVTTANTFLNNLTYNYTNAGVKSNRLLGVSDAGTAAQTSNYTYDDNGNQKTDSRKGISISYNHLNLPQTITKASTSETMSYVYDGTGKRLRKIVGTNNRDYIDGIEYNNGAIEFIQTEEGRAIPGTTYTYEYLLKDHLGNIRAGVKQDGSIVQVQDYYAFGMEMNPGNMFSSSPVNQYKYNGKEKQNELGLEQYDYGARFYDAVIGRWNVVDPLAEKNRRFNPYAYVDNNPIRFIDPDGMEKKDWIKWKSDDGRLQITYDSSVKSTADAVDKGYTNVEQVFESGVGHSTNSNEAFTFQTGGRFSVNGGEIKDVADGGYSTKNGAYISKNTSGVEQSAAALQTTGDAISVVGIMTAQPELVAAGGALNNIGLGVETFSGLMNDGFTVETIKKLGVKWAISIGFDQLNKAAIKGTEIVAGSQAVESGANVVSESIMQGTTMTGAKVTEFIVDKSKKKN